MLSVSHSTRWVSLVLSCGVVWIQHATTDDDDDDDDDHDVAAVVVAAAVAEDATPPDFLLYFIQYYSRSLPFPLHSYR